MTFESEYKSLVRRFTHHLAAQPEKKYIAPGDSASYMTEWIHHFAQVDGLSLPFIHTLSHDEATVLYFAESGSYELVKPAIVDSQLPKVSFLEDFYSNASKLFLIHGSLRMRHGLDSDFSVMVGKIAKREEYISTFEINKEMAIELDRRFNRRK